MKDKLQSFAEKAVEVVKDNPVKVVVIGVCVVGGVFALSRLIGHESNIEEEFIETVVDSINS